MLGHFKTFRNVSYKCLHNHFIQFRHLAPSHHIDRQIRLVNKVMAQSPWSGPSGSEIPTVRYIPSSSSQLNRSTAKIQPQNYDYFLVLDFEATCEDGKKMIPQEIIEFPVLKVSGQTFETEAVFHQYVEPQVHKELTPFCTQLTGIIQEMVDGHPDIDTTLKSFNKWMQEQGLLDPNVTSVFVTCGDWDLKIMLPGQCRYFQLHYPTYLMKWINIKKAYISSGVTHAYPRSMMSMLSGLNLQHEGRHHSGIDDCKNIAKIVKGVAEAGFIFEETGRL